MAQEPQRSLGRPGQKRPHGTAISCSTNYDLDYELRREGSLNRVCKYQRIPPLISRVLVKMRRTYVDVEVKGSVSPHKNPRNSHLLPGQIKFGTGKLHSITGKLSQIKAQVDSLLQSLELMGQQRTLPPGPDDSQGPWGPASGGCLCRSTKPQPKPRGQRVHAEADSSESTDQKTVLNAPSEQEDHQEEVGTFPGA